MVRQSHCLKCLARGGIIHGVKGREISVVMMKRTDREKSFTDESASVFREPDVSQIGDHLVGENATSLIAVPLDIRKREALKPLYLDRYE